MSWQKVIQLFMSSCFLKSADGRCPDSQILGLGWSYIISVLSLPREHPLLCDFQNPSLPWRPWYHFWIFWKETSLLFFFSLPQNKTSFFHLPRVQYLRLNQPSQATCSPGRPENQKKVRLFESHASWKFVFLLVSVKIQHSSKHPLEFFALWAHLVVLKSVTFRAQVS